MIIYVLQGDVGDYYYTRDLLGASEYLDDIYIKILATLSAGYSKYLIYLFEDDIQIGYVEVETDEEGIRDYQDFKEMVLSEVEWL